MRPQCFHLTARNLALDTTDEDGEECNKAILRGELQNDDGEWVEAEIDLDQVLGASDSPCKLKLQTLFPQ